MLVGAVVVLAVVAVGAGIALTRDGSSSERLDFGGGPSSEPDEEWAIDVEPAADVDLVGDGERVYVVREVDEGGSDDTDFASTTTQVTAYATSDGEELWTRDLTRSTINPVVPLGDGQVLVEDGGEDTTTLLDGATGEVVWEADGEPVDADLSPLAPAGIGPTGRPSVILLTIDGEGPEDAGEDEDDRVVAIDRESGDELWDVVADDALLCGDVVVTFAADETDGEVEIDLLAPEQGDITGWGATDGDELWSVQGAPGLCDDDDLAVVTADQEISLVDLASGDEGDPVVAPQEGTVVGIPVGDRLVVTWFRFDDDAEDAQTGSAVYPRDGGDALFEEEDAFGFPFSDELMIVADQEGDDVRLIRLSDGEEIGSQDLSLATGEDNSCAGALTATTALFCQDGEADVTAYALEEGFEERWTVDVGAPVAEATVTGDRLIVVSEDDELLAFG